ncbi:MAG: hypothetical protein KDC35_17130 [Acidobacteria bacterium]|nr:hypothetical protein [Acidobacteriota bacterium]
MWQVESANADDNAAICALQSDKAMKGRISLALERRPSFFDALSVEGVRNSVFVAKNERHEVIGMCCRSVRPVWVDGEVCALGYLGSLRVHGCLKGRIKPLAAGFRACRDDHQAQELPYDITSILSDNREARRLLERNLSHLPKYRAVAPFKTFVMTTGKSRCKGAKLQPEELPRFISFINQTNRRFDFAPAWQESDFGSHLLKGVDAESCTMIEDGGVPVATGAVWDQRAFKQTTVTGYAPLVARFRGFINLGLTVAGKPTLPSAGRQLNLGYVSLLAVQDENEDVFMEMISRLKAIARRKGLQYLVLGLDARRALAQVAAKRLHARTIESHIYTVAYEPSANPPASGLVHLEVATL